MLCKSSLIWANSYTLYQIISWIYLFESNASCFISKLKPKTKINTIKIKTITKPIPKLAKPFQNQNSRPKCQNQYRIWCIPILYIYRLFSSAKQNIPATNITFFLKKYSSNKRNLVSFLEDTKIDFGTKQLLISVLNSFKMHSLESVH